jgi:energy-coupling factor transporter ATP-binding protein EcfA2
LVSVQIAGLGEHVKNISSHIAHLKELQGYILKSAEENFSSTQGMAAEDRKRFDELRFNLDQLFDSRRPPVPETRVLRQLYFQEMFSREDTIHKPHDGTFEWILMDHRTQLPFQTHARNTLLRWLSEENGIFHISGKAGSGKSTLMKFIAGHWRTRMELEKWAGEKQLIFTSFFAWRGGNSKQHTLQGLYRFILFTVLVRRPDFIPLVFPDAVEAFSMTQSEPYIDQPFFRPPELEKAIERLAVVCSAQGSRLCILIDGLDEFKNDAAQRHSHTDIAEKLELWAQGEGVKFLVSSRPESAFCTLAPPERQLHLHELTRPDIETMALSMFENHHTFEHVRPYYLKLVKWIVDKAKGVFQTFLSRPLSRESLIRSTSDGLTWLRPVLLRPKASSSLQAQVSIYFIAVPTISCKNRRKFERFLRNIAACDQLPSWSRPTLPIFGSAVWARSPRSDWQSCSGTQSSIQTRKRNIDGSTQWNQSLATSRPHSACISSSRMCLAPPCQTIISRETRHGAALMCIG